MYRLPHNTAHILQSCIHCWQGNEPPSANRVTERKRKQWGPLKASPLDAWIKWLCRNGLNEKFGGSRASLFDTGSQNIERKLASSCLSVFPFVHVSVRMEQDGFSWNLIFGYFFRKSVEKIKAWLKFNKNKGYFTCGVTCVYDISLNFT